MTWSPAQYLAFEDDRTRPVRDLVAAIPAPEARRAIDLGCGPGNSTEVLLARFPGATVCGADSSLEMVEAARKRLPGVAFDIADISTWDAPGPFDAILANAVLQWVPDHATILPRLVERLTKGGSLAVQMPDNLEEPAHVAMRAVAAAGPWSSRLASAAGQRVRMDDASDYYRLLRPACGRIDLWRTTYFHVLPGGVDAIIEWFKGSGLRPFLQPLSPPEQADFLDRYRTAVAGAYPVQADGAVLLPFPRLFLVATR